MPELSHDVPAQEHRRFSRKRVARRGKIVYGDGAFSIDCLIRVISAKGARVRIDKGTGIPTHVYLINIPEGIAYAAEVASIRVPMFGLCFLRQYRLAELTDPSLKYLKDCWVGCAR